MSAVAKKSKFRVTKFRPKRTEKKFNQFDMICDFSTRASIIGWWFQRQPEHFLHRLMLSNWIDDNQAWNQPFHVNKNVGNCTERPDLVTRPKERWKINQNNWERDDLWRNDVSAQDAALCGLKATLPMPIAHQITARNYHLINLQIFYQKKKKIVWPELSETAKQLGLAFFQRIIHKNSFKDHCGLLKFY